MFSQFEALIIDPNPFSRNNLWQATLAEQHFQHAKTVGELKDAIAQISIGVRYDIFLITSEFSLKEINEFISQAKALEAGAEAAYVLVMKKKHQQEDHVVDGVIEGIDGFLFEPFNLDSLREVSEVATKVRQKHQSARAKAALAMLLDKIMPVFADLVRDRRRKKPGTEPLSELQRLRRSLKRILETDQTVFVDIMTEKFSAASPRVKTKSQYHGASERVRKMMES